MSKPPSLEEIHKELAERRCQHARERWEKVKNSRESTFVPASDKEIEEKLLSINHPFIFDQLIFQYDYMMERWSDKVAEHWINLKRHRDCDSGDIFLKKEN